MKTLSIVIPFFNEAENLKRIYDELLAVRRSSLAKYGFEILLLDNHSTDGSFEIASEIATSDPVVKVIRQSRNFGYQANILTGLLRSTGDAVVQLDADGEDDPALIADLVAKWEEGFKIVYGIRRTRVESGLLTFQRKVFYRFLNVISSINIPVDAGDFRLLDRQVVKTLENFREANPYLRGLIAYMGFDQTGIIYDRRKRWKGESKFSWWDYLRLAWTGITSFSAKPLIMATWLGIALSALSFLGGFFYVFLYFFVGVPVQGFTTLILVQLFLAGIQLLCIGLAGQYIGFIFEEVKRRPRSIVEKEFPHDLNSTRLR